MAASESIIGIGSGSIVSKVTYRRLIPEMRMSPLVIPMTSNAPQMIMNSSVLPASAAKMAANRTIPVKWCLFNL